MCEHARSSGMHGGGGKSPSPAPELKPMFPPQMLVEGSVPGHNPETAEAATGGFYRRVYPSIRNLFVRLQQDLHGVPFPHSPEKIAAVSDMLMALDVDPKEWSDFARFDGNKYTRNLIAHDENFTVLLLCWNKNQRSPIHDHAGSSCWVKCLKGKLRERRFAFPTEGNSEKLKLIGDCVCNEGEVCYINDTQGIHEMGNPDADDVTVTMHIYSPPYYNCLAFDEDSSARRCVSMLAASAPQREILGPELADAANAAAARIAAGGKDGSNSKCCDAGPPPGSLSLAQLIKKLDSPTSTEEDAVKAFSTLYLSKAEWSSFVHFADHRFQRLMLHTNHKFSLLILCWLPGQQTPPHDHRGSKSWVRVLSGELFYHEVSDDGKVVEGSEKKITHCAGTPFVEDAALATHIVGNKTETFAVSIHLYNPPYTELTYTDIAPRCGDGSCHHDDMKDRVSHSVIPYAWCQQAMSKINKAAPPGSGEGGGQFPSSAVSPLMPHQHHMLSNFYILQEKLGIAFASSQPLQQISVSVMEILEDQMFFPQELERYWKIRENIDFRVRLHDSELFCVSLNLWNPEHESVIHDHDGSLSWMKVLDGALMDTVFEESTDGAVLEESNTSRLITGSVTFYGSKTKHALSNSSKSRRAISLHVYCSPQCAGKEQTAARRSLVQWGSQQACRWYTRNHPKQAIRVLSVTAVENMSWSMPASPVATGEK